MIHFSLSSSVLLAATWSLMTTDVSTERVVTCDLGANVQRLSCDSGVIGVQKALYGRTDRQTCSDGRPQQELLNTACSLQGTFDLLRTRCSTSGENSTIIIRTTLKTEQIFLKLVGGVNVSELRVSRCDGKRVCELNTNDVRTSDPCTGTFKYLETNYTCFPAIHLNICENSEANLHCDDGQVIFVYGADYGRRDPTTCSHRRPVSNLQNVLCSNPTKKVAESCNRKSSCRIRALNSVFGDQCFGTYKYLEVSYTCQYPV